MNDSEKQAAPELSKLLDDFKAHMLAKFIARETKHPGQSSVTSPDFDWKGEDLASIDLHLICEVGEFFGLDKHEQADLILFIIERRKPADKNEAIDIANMAFLSRQIRRARET